jgi:hypothetical protein
VPRLAFPLLIALLQAACVAALPPTRTDVASSISSREGVVEHGRRVSSGVHWASGTRSRNVPFDLGAGVVYERMSASATTDSTLKSQIDEPRHNDSVGGYLEAAARLSAGGLTRTWVGGRAEFLRDTSGRSSTASIAARVSWELYGGGTAAGAEGGGNGFVMFAGGGTAGIGTYVESGVRLSPEHSAEFLLSAGLSVRLPAFVAVGFACR